MSCFHYHCLPGKETWQCESVKNVVISSILCTPSPQRNLTVTSLTFCFQSTNTSEKCKEMDRYSDFPPFHPSRKSDSTTGQREIQVQSNFYRKITFNENLGFSKLRSILSWTFSSLLHLNYTQRSRSYCNVIYCGDILSKMTNGRN